MDTIKFIIDEPYETAFNIKGVGVSLYLNGKKVPHDILNLPKVLAVHSFKFAEFDLYTCSCGVPGCAGFHSPVIQNKNNRIVKWTFPESGDYKTEKKIYLFNETDFNNEMSDLLSSILNLENHKIYNTCVIPEVNDVEYNIFFEVKSIVESVNWYKNRYEAEEKQNEMLSKDFPDNLDKKLVLTYDGKHSKYSYILAHMVSKTLNQFPEKSNDSFYINKCRLMAKAIVKATCGDNTRFHKLLNNISNQEDLFWLIDNEFDDMDEENFKLEKVGIEFLPIK